ncbi:MAG: leucine-rich repeat protein [Eubacterium sp.]|nr:leucine-rich repeat protein [Eubacterium sp.]
MNKKHFLKKGLTLILSLSLLLAYAPISESNAKEASGSAKVTVSRNREKKYGLSSKREAKRIQVSHSEFEKLEKQSKSAWKGIKQCHVQKNRKLSEPVAGDTTGWTSYGNYYFYNQLNDDEKAFYERLLSCSLAFMTSGEGVERDDGDGKYYYMPGIEVGNVENQKDYNITMMFKYNNPEFYFIDTLSAFYTDKETGRKMVCIEIYQTFMTADARQKNNAIMKNKIESTLAKITGDSEYEKVKSIHDTIADMTRYQRNFDYDIIDYNQSIYSVFMMQAADYPDITETVCLGYAKAFVLLCSYFGIDAIVVTSEPHAWNRVKIDDVWYELDITWDDGDTVYAEYEGEKIEVDKYYISYDYFLRSDKQIKNQDVKENEGAHLIEKAYDDFACPPCTHDLVPSKGVLDIELPNGEITQRILDGLVAGKPLAPPTKSASSPELSVKRGKSAYTLSFTGSGFDHVYYTIDGTEPKVGQAVSTMYTAPFEVPISTDTIKARTVRDGYLEAVTEYKISVKKKNDTLISMIIYKSKQTGAKAYSVSSGTVFVKAGSVSIPSVITSDGTKCKVTAVDSEAFRKIKKMKNTTLGKNLSSLGTNSFRDCKALKTVKILAKKLKKVGKNAFKNTAKGIIFKIKAGKTDYKRICKLIKNSGNLPKNAKFKRVA